MKEDVFLGDINFKKEKIQKYIKFNK